MNTAYFDDEITISHPAYLIGHTANTLIFQDEWNKLFCLILSEGESPEMFDTGDVFEASELQPLSQESSRHVQERLDAGR